LTAKRPRSSNMYHFYTPTKIGAPLAGFKTSAMPNRSTLSRYVYTLRTLPKSAFLYSDSLTNFSKNILSFNEPDQDGGGGTLIPVDVAVEAHKRLIQQPFAGKGLRIGSPSVTNGGEDNKGIGYLTKFMKKCTDCQIDFVVAHYYGTDNADTFITYLKKFHDAFQKPVWVTEFGVNPNQGDADAFLKAVLPFLETTSWIERYAYHMVAPDVENKSYLVKADGSGLSKFGATYASF